MPSIKLVTNECIQCKTEVALPIDNFTLYQAEKGQHYLYCDNCMSPYEPIQNDLPVSEPKATNRTIFGLLLLGLGIIVGLLF